MKLMHLSDLHFGIKLHEHNINADQDFVWEQIERYLQETAPDAVVIAGDIYNRSDPGPEAIARFQTFLKGVRGAAPDAKIMIVAGNHDDPTRIDQFCSFLDSVDVYMVGNPPNKPEEYIKKVVLKDEFGPVNFYLLPYFKPSWVKDIVGQDENGKRLSSEASLKILLDRENIDWNQRNVIVSHQYYSAFSKDADVDPDYLAETMGGEEAISGDLIRPFDYAALGHIHRPGDLGDRYHRYCGTPMAYSLNEVGQNKAALLVELGAKGSIDVKELPLKPLRRIVKLTGTIDEVLALKEEYGNDYVFVTLKGQNDYQTSTGTLLREAFPYLLKYVWERVFQPHYDLEIIETKKLDPMELCLSFLNEELTEEEKELLSEVVEEAKGECK